MGRYIASSSERNTTERADARPRSTLPLITLIRLFLILFAPLATLAFVAPAKAQISFTLITGDSTANNQKLLIDSNKCVSDGPRAAYVGGIITNTGSTEITNVNAVMSGLNANVFFSGGQAASQSIGTLGAGESIGVYWHVGYSCSEFATATPTISVTSSAGSLNRIVTLEIFDAISANAGGSVESTLLGPGAVVGQTISMDVEYSFGGANAGDEYFLQPAGNQAFNAGCFRLVGAEVLSSGVSAVPVGSVNQLYFVASIQQTGSNHRLRLRYYFQYLCQNQSTVADPYAAQTSGNTNIKYTGNFGSTVITYPPGTNPFTISKSVTPDSATIGDGTSALTYTVTITNPSPNATVIDSITDQLPSGMAFVAIAAGSDVTASNSSSVPASGASGTLNFIGRLGSSYALPANSSISLVYTASVPSTAGEYVNSAQAHFGQASTPTTSTTFTLLPPPVAASESGTAFAGTTSTPIANVRSNDTVGGVQADATNSTIAISGSWPGGITLDTDSGAIEVSGTVPAGVYSIDYQLCDLRNPPNCVTATNTITVNAPEADLLIAKTNGTSEVYSGSTTTYTLTVTHGGGDPVTGAVVSDNPGAGLTCDAANPVTITGDGVPAGSFTIADLTGGGIALDTLTSGQTTTLTYNCQVN